MASRARGDNDVDLEPHQLGREVGKPLSLSLRVPELEGDVLSLHIPEILQALREGHELGRGAQVDSGQHADAKDLLRLLRLSGGQQRAEEAEGKKDAADGAAPHGDLLLSTWYTWIDPEIDRFFSG